MAPAEDRTPVVVDIDGRIAGGEAAGGDGQYAADQVRLAASFDDRLRATAPRAGDTEGLAIERDVDTADDAVDHRYAATSDRTRRAFTACQRSLVTASARPDAVSYTANGRFRWRNARLLREDDHWHHHTPGRAVWYPDGGR
jgi:hypothetical protein